MKPIARMLEAGTEGKWDMLLKRCRCGKLVPQSMKMCEECERKQRSRHVIYNTRYRDKRAAEFYVSKEWRALRPVIMRIYDYVDIYALYIQHELKTLKESDPVHHIIELDEDWDQRLNPMNLIPLKNETHNAITALYKRSREDMRATQKQLNLLIGKHFKEAGGYEKVLGSAFLVAPPLNFGENSPRKFQQIG